MPNKPGRVFGRIGRRIERAVVGDGRDLERRDLALLGRADLDVHVVVAREARGRQIFGARLDPLDRNSEHDRGDRRDDVARIDRNLVAEAAADVGRDDVDLVLGNAGDERDDGAVRVGRLRGEVERQPSGRPDSCRRRSRTVRAAPDGSAGSRARSLMLDLRRRQRRIGLRAVADFPVIDVVGLVLAIVAQDRLVLPWRRTDRRPDRAARIRLRRVRPRRRRPRARSAMTPATSWY